MIGPDETAPIYKRPVAGLKIENAAHRIPGGDGRGCGTAVEASRIPASQHDKEATLLGSTKGTDD